MTPANSPIPTSLTTSNPLVCLAFDFGEARIGVAVGNSLTRQPQALETIHHEDNASRFGRIQALIAEWTPNCLVVGIPRHPDGQAHAMTERCERFCRQLEGRFGKTVYRVDERYSSVEAESRLQAQRSVTRSGVTGRSGANRGSGGGRSGDRQSVDAVAACIILEQFFQELAQ